MKSRCRLQSTFLFALIIPFQITSTLLAFVLLIPDVNSKVRARAKINTVIITSSEMQKETLKAGDAGWDPHPMPFIIKGR